MPFAQNIVFPVDFSASASALVPAVAAMARRLRAPLTLLYSADALRTEPELAEPIERHAREKLSAFGGAGGFEGLAVTRLVVPGPPAAAIVACARQMAAPLVMMPTRGESAFRRLLLGSVTASVLHDADCPVWTSAHCEDGGPVPAAYGSIVCAVDLGPRTPDLLSGAHEFAADFGARLHVVHSVPGIDARFPSAAADRAHAFLVDTARDAYPQLAKSTGLELPALEIVEDVGLCEGIVAAAARHKADLLIIGRGSVQGVLGRLRTNAHELIRQSLCPVLSV